MAISGVILPAIPLLARYCPANAAQLQLVPLGLAWSGWPTPRAAAAQGPDSPIEASHKL